MNIEEMEDILTHIADMAALVYSKEAFWKVKEMSLMPPAKDDQIESLSNELPFQLPDSYVQFLKLHDGCLNFWPKFAFVGTKGEAKDIVYDKIEDARQHLNERITDLYGSVSEENIIQYEIPVKSRQRYYLPNHIVFSTNRGGEFFMFNEKQQTKEGEFEVIHYTYDGGAYYRYPDFPSFLIATVSKLEKRIKDKRYAKKKGK